MKILTANFLTCAVKSCKSSPQSYPLHFQDAELEQTEMEYNPLFLKNLLPRIEWDALRITASELGFTTLPEAKPELSNTSDAKETEESKENREGGMNGEQEKETKEKLWKDLHKLLLETQVMEGKLVCGNCGHEYKIKEGIANFLLPNHLV